MIPSSLQSVNSYPEVLEQLEVGIKTIEAVNLSKYVSGMSIDISGRFTIPTVQNQPLLTLYFSTTGPFASVKKFASSFRLNGH